MPSIETVNAIEKVDIHKDLQNLDRPRKHYQWYYSSKIANHDMCNSDQGIEKFLRAYYHVKVGIGSLINLLNLKLEY